jgi:glycosyltransferase involved in cell wall biosynthesis
VRIVITVASLAPEYGGPSAKALSLAAALRSLGHDVSVLGCAGDGIAEATGLGNIGGFHGTPIPRRIGPLLRQIRGSDVVHILGFRDPVGTAAALLARRYGVPYLVEPAGMLQPRLRSFRLKRGFDAVVGEPLTRRATFVVATSRAEAEQIAAAGVEPTRIRVRFNGVHLDGLFPLPDRGALRERLGIPDDVPLLLTVGRIAAIKGLEHVAEAMARLPWAHWLVAGPDEGDGTLEALRRIVDELDVADRVTIVVGGLWGRAKAEALADADAFCMASENESFGSAAAEAACAGLPLAISATCGVLDCLDRTTLRTFWYGDIEGIAAAVTWALQDPSAGPCAAGAADRLRKELDWHGVVEQQLAIYEQAR